MSAHQRDGLVRIGGSLLGTHLRWIAKGAIAPVDFVLISICHDAIGG
jgi:hypothetical protein